MMPYQAMMRNRCESPKRRRSHSMKRVPRVDRANRRFARATQNRRKTTISAGQFNGSIAQLVKKEPACLSRAVFHYSSGVKDRVAFYARIAVWESPIAQTARPRASRQRGRNFKKIMIGKKN